MEITGRSVLNCAHAKCAEMLLQLCTFYHLSPKNSKTPVTNTTGVGMQEGSPYYKHTWGVPLLQSLITAAKKNSIVELSQKALPYKHLPSQNAFCPRKASFSPSLIRVKIGTHGFCNTQEIKRTLFNWTKQNKTCKFSRKSSFSSYVQHKNKQFNSSCVS